ncbi:MYG1 family protein [Roseiconus lacunae]|uniref:MYG1 family protein n=1 Tax=Roseiconus lacunae TaxID=2605694 RepID=UPI001E48AEF9|nr:MYG1 family protein [Roseiconus lacunae]MCD0460682.1 MYG1 family protein [Roseiconus lacunae]
MPISSERPNQSEHQTDQLGQSVQIHAKQTPPGITQANQDSAKEIRVANKVKLLNELHGERVQRLIEDGRIPNSQLDNFYGRHLERQTAILDAMEQGASYSKAYNRSAGCFDTTSWAKLARRTATVRGLVLKSVVKALEDDYCEQEISAARSLFIEVRSISDQLLEAVVDHSLDPAPVVENERRAKKKSISKFSDRGSVIGSLRSARSKLAKNLRDARRFVEKMGESPSADDVARVAVECARIHHGIRTFEICVGPERNCSSAANVGDVLGAGDEYWSRFAASLSSFCPDRMIATHQKPDADALVATWMIERYLFPNETCRVDFIPRSPEDSSLDQYDAVLDIGCVYEPRRRRFDHKPPVFDDRNEHCAASLVFRHLADRGVEVGHLSELVKLVHDGDAATRRGKSEQYARSRERGLHAVVQHAQAYATSDAMCYHGVAMYLDAVWRGDDEAICRSNRM